MTRIELSDVIKKSPRTTWRYLKDINDNPSLLQKLNNGEAFSAGKDDVLPIDVIIYVIKEKLDDKSAKEAINQLFDATPTLEAAGKVIPAGLDDIKLDHSDMMTDEFGDIIHDNGFVTVVPVEAKIKMTPTRPDDNDIPANDIPKDVGPENDTESNDTDINDVAPGHIAKNVFGSGRMSLVMIVILILADSFSCGWIANAAFPGIKILIAGLYINPAVVFFSSVGAAVAFASIRNAVFFDGWEADSWLWGFGIAQFVLHASAFQLFGDWSLIAGKWIICLCIPLATTGIAVTFKTLKA